MNNGFEFTDNYSIFSRGRIREIAGDFLFRHSSDREAFIYVNEIRVYTKYDFMLNQFHKEIDVVKYTYSENPLFVTALTESLNVIQTKINLNEDIPNVSKNDEHDLEDIFNNDTSLTFSVDVLVLQKSGINKT
uniref:Uncharacterized protein n=1 Tax=Strongyloides papillosus TaxID=174720 RepID=A0A0N5C690_STREA